MSRRRSSSFSRPARTLLGRRTFLFLNLAIALLLGGWYFTQPASRQEEVRRLVGTAFAREKQVSPLEVAWDLWQLYYLDTATGRIATGDKTHVYGGAPTRAGSGSGRLRILVNRGYAVGYDDALAHAAWAAYRLRDLAGPTTIPPRPSAFSVDLRTAARVSPEAYANSGYDRGHLAPNYAIAAHYGAAAQEETFLMSNITPQRHALNAGLWKQLEQRLATNYPARYGEIWVLTGPIFGERPRQLRSGVRIPEAFFLVVVDEHEGKLRTLSLSVPQDVTDLADASAYLTTIDEIERRTGLDLLAELDDASEAEIEQRLPSRLW